MSDQPVPLPPATLEFFVVSLKMQAELQLGLAHFGDDKDVPEPNFRIARHTIDLLAMLQEKTKGNVTLEEQRLLENTLMELRFRFVQVMEEQQRRASSGAAEAQAAKPEGQAGR